MTPQARHVPKAIAHSLKRSIPATVLALLACACAPRTVMNFNRLDGRTDTAATAQFQQDDAI